MLNYDIAEPEVLPVHEQTDQPNNNHQSIPAPTSTRYASNAKLFDRRTRAGFTTSNMASAKPIATVSFSQVALRAYHSR